MTRGLALGAPDARTIAYRSKILSFPEVELLLQEIAVRPDIWISAKLCEQVLQTLRQS